MGYEENVKKTLRKKRKYKIKNSVKISVKMIWVKMQSNKQKKIKKMCEILQVLIHFMYYYFCH